MSLTHSWFEVINEIAWTESMRIKPSIGGERKTRMGKAEHALTESERHTVIQTQSHRHTQSH